MVRVIGALPHHESKMQAENTCEKLEVSAIFLTFPVYTKNEWCLSLARW